MTRREGDQHSPLRLSPGTAPAAAATFRFESAEELEYLKAPAIRRKSQPTPTHLDEGELELLLTLRHVARREFREDSGTLLVRIFAQLSPLLLQPRLQQGGGMGDCDAS